MAGKAKKSREFEKGEHYRVVFFYARAYQPTFRTQREALNWIKAKGLTSTALHYSEVWKMKNEYDGERELLLENSVVVMVDK